jgi:hypothetical protein
MQRMTSIVAGAGSKSTARRRGAPFCGERGEVTRSRSSSYLQVVKMSTHKIV